MNKLLLTAKVWRAWVPENAFTIKPSTNFCKMKKQNYLCVDLSTRMHDHDIRMGETRKGVLTMVVDEEKFSFEEAENERWTRNPKVWQGEYINVHRDKEGHYQVHLKKMELNKWFSPVRVGIAIQRELLTAKKVLGV